MRVLWIIGNGFDLNLGLATGYRSFLDRAYSLDEAESARRSKLEKAVGEELADPKSDHWSDLEALLANATEGYSPEDEEFDETFEAMQRLFVDYVASEERRMPESLDGSSVEEFWDSVTHFNRRLVERDRARLQLSNPGSESIGYYFLSLNYTRTFDRFLDAAKMVHAPFDSARRGSANYEDVAHDVFHLHGEFGDEGPRGIVFGIADSSRAKNPDFSTSARFAEMWVKPGKNAVIYANNKTERMREMVGNANVVCIYGCSLGDSDSYIWEAVGDRFRSTQKTNVVLFVHGLPERLGLEGRRYQKLRDKSLAKFCEVAGLNDIDPQTLRDRVMLVPSNEVFKTEMALGENDTYPDAGKTSRT